MANDIFNDHDTLQKIRQYTLHLLGLTFANLAANSKPPRVHNSKAVAEEDKVTKLIILLKAWPDMAAVHRPDFQAFRKEPESAHYAGTRYRDHFIWPYINKEDLTKPKLSFSG